ncbi:hypothetical protein H7H82_00175 [Mycobacterium heidelbergense]|nr:hypothetical protein [Mycobacterium heidelbergense]MCV7049037.1 hypothetical protein [Mycobacterium heidelbergense]BBZ50367.1 hypothetical protein MHEI_20840 [Mycobacterium heidelbergense]
MDLAARPRITLGVAVAAASIITVTPVTQHLPGLHLAQRLSEVSVSDIRLTDASSAIDLFTGMENELASLASGASAVPVGLASAAFDPTQNLVVQTWMNTFQTAGANLETIYNTWSNIPAPLLQQVAANWINYGNIYVGSFQTAAAAAFKYFTGTGANNFAPSVQQAFTALMSGNFQNALNGLYSALYQVPLQNIGLPLESILNIPTDIVHEFYNATNYMLGAGVANAVTYGAIALPEYTEQAFSASTQAFISSWNAGDPLGALTNLANIPGATVNAFLNGNATGLGGLLSSTAFGKSDTGLLNLVVNTIPQAMAKAIVAPGAINILTAKGNVGFTALQTAFQSFVNNSINGWPALGSYLGSRLANIPAELTAALQSIPSVLANLPSMLSNFGGALASSIGLLVSNLLKLL